MDYASGPGGMNMRKEEVLGQSPWKVRWEGRLLDMEPLWPGSPRHQPLVPHCMAAVAGLSRSRIVPVS